MNTKSAIVSETAHNRICPWWMAYFFDNPLRRIMHPADRILGDYLSKGMTVMDFGCGFGHFSLGMARLTGMSGKVYAVDVQSKMLAKTMTRAARAALDGIIQPVLCKTHSIGITVEMDFILACNSLHETPDPAVAVTELFSLLKPGGRFLLMEPRAHLEAKSFEDEVALAREAGFKQLERPEIVREMCVLFEKSVVPAQP